MTHSVVCCHEVLWRTSSGRQGYVYRVCPQYKRSAHSHTGVLSDAPSATGMVTGCGTGLTSSGTGMDHGVSRGSAVDRDRAWRGSIAATVPGETGRAGDRLAEDRNSAGRWPVA